MSSNQATPPYRPRTSDSGSGAFLMILTLFLGIAVGVLAIVAVALLKTADDARDEAKAASVTTDHSTHASAESSTVSLPIESFAGAAPEKMPRSSRPPHKPFPAELPGVPPATSSRCR